MARQNTCWLDTYYSFFIKWIWNELPSTLFRLGAAYFWLFSPDGYPHFAGETCHPCHPTPSPRFQPSLAWLGYPQLAHPSTDPLAPVTLNPTNQLSLGETGFWKNDTPKKYVKQFVMLEFSLKPSVMPNVVDRGSDPPTHSNSPTNSRRGLRRQANYEEQQPLKSGWCSNPNLSRAVKSEQLSGRVAKSATSTNIGRWTSIQSGFLEHHEPL